MKRKRRVKIYEFTVITVALAILYVVYKEDIYKWSCETEGTNSACYIVGLIKEEQGDHEAARYWTQKSCDLKYKLACDKLKILDLKK